MSGCILHLSISHSHVFLVNSCLDLFSAPNSRWDPFSRSYRANLPSSLTVIRSSALVCSTRLRVSVSGTGGASSPFSGFSWEHGYALWLRACTPPAFRFGSPGGFACRNLHLLPYACFSVCRQGCHSSVPASLQRASNGIFTVSSIGFAVRLILRSRLTLIRLALIRKP